MSNGFNAVQIALKVAAFALSGGSMAVLATLLDSFLSAVAGTVVTIATAAVNARGADDVVQYPVGKGRMEPVSGSCKDVCVHRFPEAKCERGSTRTG